MVVLAHLAVLLELLRELHAVAPHVADGHARVLGILVRKLDQFLAAIGVEHRDRQADELPSTMGLSPRLASRMALSTAWTLALVPDLHRDHARFRNR